MATDFTMKPQVDPTAIAALAQKQAAEQAQLDQQASENKLKEFQAVAQGVSGMVSASIEASKARQKKEMLKNYGDSMAARFVPNLTLPQQGPGLPTAAPEGPVASANAYQQGEQALPPVSTPDYIGRKALSGEIQRNPDIWTKQLAEQLIQSPLQQAETQKNAAQAVKDRQLTGPVTPATQMLVNQLHAKLKTPPPDLSNMTEQQANQYYDNAAKLIEKPSASNPGDLTDADRARLTPLAKAVVEGRATPAALVSARGAEKEKLSMIAAEIDPNFDLSLAPQRSKMRQDYTPAGNSGKSLTALNTVIGHLDTLQTKIAALDNADITKYNTIANWAAKNTGDPRVAGFNAAKTLVDSELGKIAQGSGVVTNEERQQFRHDLSDASSPAQAKEVIATWMDLMKSRTDAIKSNWQQTMGNVNPPVPFINDKAKKILVKNGYNPGTMEKTTKPAANDPLGIRG